MGTRIGLDDVPVPAIIVVRSEDQRSADLVRQIRRGLEPLSTGPVTRALGESARWKLVECKSYRAFLGFDLHLFARVASP